MRLRHGKSPEGWLIKTAIVGYGTAPHYRRARVPRPRSKEDTHPDRISSVGNVETLMGSDRDGRTDLPGQ